jgi:hypothetical protein
MGYHLYNWHWIPFNNDYPHYFPVKEGLAEGVEAMHKHNIHVMPYVNGRIWDTKDNRGEDYRFEKEALAHTSKSLNGEPDIETYASHEPDGSLVKLAAICPSSWLWRQELLKIVTRLFREYHMDAVYLDQIAAACMNLCCDESHLHTPGNGGWWVESYRLLMETLRSRLPADCGFTTEDNAEVYADQFDGFLTWAWITSNLVPVFPVIYGGYIAMLGRNTNGYKKNDLPYYRYHVAQAVLFGQQIGWLNADLVDDPEKLSFMKKMASLRYNCRDFFSAGDMLRPPVLRNKGPRIITDTGMGMSIMFDGDALLAGAWRKREDGAVLIMLVNVGDIDAAFDFDVPWTEYGLSFSAFKAINLEGDQKAELELYSGGIRGTLRAHQCAALENM